MANGWTPERKRRQAELIQTWKPWEKSIGPKTVEGKAVVSRNAFKGSLHTQSKELLREVSRLLREQKDAMNRV